MTSEPLEDTAFDAIVLGTGLTESIVAGALSRAGKKVLHLDSNDYYGSLWSAFGFKELVRWIAQDNSPDTQNDAAIHPNANRKKNLRGVSLHLPEPQSDEENDTSAIDEDIRAVFEAQSSSWSATQLSQLCIASRAYNFDAAPKLLSCNSGLVDILIQSGVGRYLEFKGVDDVFVFDADKKTLEKVPSSKEDIFSSKQITLVDKRKLMKFLTFAMTMEDQAIEEQHLTMPYAQFLQEKFMISGKLQNAILYAIAVGDKSSPTPKGLEKTQAFLRSMGRFTRGGYLCTMYGGGSEIAQAFCRICAVYGGIYMLGQPLSHFTIEENQCTGVVTQDGQTFSCNWLIAGIDYLHDDWVTSDEGTWVDRAIVVSDKSLAKAEQSDEGSNAGFSVFPPGSEAGNTDTPIYAIHQSHETMACPKGEFVTYLWTETTGGDALKRAVDLLLKSQDAAARFTVYYEQRLRQAKADWPVPTNVLLCSDPTSSLDYDEAVREAQALFKQCLPDQEFLPSQNDDQHSEDDD